MAIFYKESHASQVLVNMFHPILLWERNDLPSTLFSIPDGHENAGAAFPKARRHECLAVLG